jgi:hypothetical protein
MSRESSEERPHVVFIESHQLSKTKQKSSCWTSGVASLPLALESGSLQNRFFVRLRRHFIFPFKTDQYSLMTTLQCIYFRQKLTNFASAPWQFCALSQKLLRMAWIVSVPAQGSVNFLDPGLCCGDKIACVCERGRHPKPDLFLPWFPPGAISRGSAAMEGIAWTTYTHLGCVSIESRIR